MTFRTASGESVVVGDFENGYISGNGGGSNITFAGPVNARSFRSDKASNIVVDSWRVDCGGCDDEQMFHIEQADNVTVKNSDISDNKNNSLMWINGSNLTFENNQIHDAGLPSGLGVAYGVHVCAVGDEPDLEAEPLLPLLGDGCVHHR